MSDLTISLNERMADRFVDSLNATFDQAQGTVTSLDAVAAVHIGDLLHEQGAGGRGIINGIEVTGGVVTVDVGDPADYEDDGAAIMFSALCDLFREYARCTESRSQDVADVLLENVQLSSSKVPVT